MRPLFPLAAAVLLGAGPVAQSVPGLGAGLSLEGTHVVPHRQSTEMRYRKAADFSLGARVEVFLRNASAEPLRLSATRVLLLRGRIPEELLRSGERARIEGLRRELVLAEEATGFDPGVDPDDLARLRERPTTKGP